MELADRIPLIIPAPNTHLFHGAFKGHNCERFSTPKHYIHMEAENKKEMSGRAPLQKLVTNTSRHIASAPLVSSAQIPW